MGRQMQPIRDLGTVFRVADELRERTDPRGRRMYMLWIVGINMGMRISDIVDLKVGDLRGQKQYTYLPHKQEHKRGAHKITIPVPPDVRLAVEERCADLPADAWLFPSRKKNRQRKILPMAARSQKNRERPTNPGAITRQTALRDMREIARVCGIEDGVGCHTMRKTFGYHYYRKGGNLQKLQEWFYHSTPATTLVYIGIQFEDFQKMTDNSPFAGMARPRPNC